MSTRIVLIDHVVYTSTKDGDICTGCPRHHRPSGSCVHFDQLALKLGTKSPYLRHVKCIRAEERTGHASTSQVMMEGDFGV